jgi:segregation and condensation protein B
MEDTKAKVEALLHCNAKGYTVDEFSKHTGIRKKGLIKDALHHLRIDYVERKGGLKIDEVDGVWKMRVKSAHVEAVTEAARPEIDKAILQTLAYIAHKQPIRQADVVRIRSNKAYSHISELVKHGFIEAKKDGVSKKLSTTRKFYDYFDLPKDEPFELEE